MTDTKPQAEKFKAMAKEVETNDNEQSFDATLKAIAAVKPKQAAKQ